MVPTEFCRLHKKPREVAVVVLLIVIIIIIIITTYNNYELNDHPEH